MLGAFLSLGLLRHKRVNHLFFHATFSSSKRKRENAIPYFHAAYTKQHVFIAAADQSVAALWQASVACACKG